MCINGGVRLLGWCFSMVKDTYALFTQLPLHGHLKLAIMPLCSHIFFTFFLSHGHICPSDCLSAKKESAVQGVPKVRSSNFMHYNF